MTAEDHLDTLLERHFAGELSPTEQGELDDLLRRSGAVRERLAATAMHEVALSELLGRRLPQVPEPLARRSPRRRMVAPLRAAAAALRLLGVSIWLIPSSPEINGFVTSGDVQPRPGGGYRAQPDASLTRGGTTLHFRGTTDLDFPSDPELDIEIFSGQATIESDGETRVILPVGTLRCHRSNFEITHLRARLE